MHFNLFIALCTSVVLPNWTYSFIGKGHKLDLSIRTELKALNKKDKKDRYTYNLAKSGGSRLEQSKSKRLKVIMINHQLPLSSKISTNYFTFGVRYVTFLSFTMISLSS